MGLCLNKRSIRSNSSNRSKRFERLKRLERFELRSLAGSSLDRHSFVVLPGTMNSPGYRAMPPFEPLPAHDEWLHASLRALSRRSSRRS